MFGCSSGNSIIETPKRSILGEVTNSQYVSPNANLKLLTNVALQNSYQRKEKSLQILCDRFLEMYPLYGCSGRTKIHLDETAKRLGVEKRRIYDIINILEALQCAEHSRKNTYVWHGAARLEAFLATLRAQGQLLGVASPDRSLGILAQRFLMMFLVEPPNALINLEMAVRVLINPGGSSWPRHSPSHTPDITKPDPQLKSKVRRLYDISNVLSSIGLIEKVPGSTILKKPVFRYRGPKHLSCKQLFTPPMSSTQQLTPVSLVVRANSLMYPYPSPPKRRLIFSSPGLPPSPVSGSSTPPPTPSKHKWDEILQVVNMELSRINGTT